MNQKKANLDLALEQLKSEKFSEELYINLNSQRINNDNAKAIAQALQLGEYLNRLIIDLSWNKITCKGAKAIAEVLQSGKCPDKLKVYLSGNQIGDKGSMELVQALQSKKCSDGLIIICQNGNVSFQKVIEKHNVRQKVLTYFSLMQWLTKKLSVDVIKLIGRFAFGLKFFSNTLVSKIFTKHEEIYKMSRIKSDSALTPFKSINTDAPIPATSNPAQFQSPISSNTKDSNNTHDSNLQSQQQLFIGAIPKPEI